MEIQIPTLVTKLRGEDVKLPNYCAGCMATDPNKSVPFHPNYSYSGPNHEFVKVNRTLYVNVCENCNAKYKGLRTENRKGGTSKSLHKVLSIVFVLFGIGLLYSYWPEDSRSWIGIIIGAILVIGAGYRYHLIDEGEITFTKHNPENNFLLGGCNYEGDLYFFHEEYNRLFHSLNSR